MIAACSEGHVSVVELLLEHVGVDAIPRDKNGTSAAMAAAGPVTRCIKCLF
jgi:ankyrin repeat protein